MKILKFILAIIVMFIMWIAIVGSALYSLSLPIVEYSNSLQQCYKIIDKGIERDCDDMPEKYILVYVM
jgi:hypothetical protein